MSESWQSADACFGLSDVQSLKTCFSSLCAHPNVIHGAKRSHLAQDYNDFCPWEERGGTVNASRWSEGAAVTGALGGDGCVSAAGVCPGLACSDRWQGSCCKGFQGKITGQFVLLESKGKAGAQTCLQECPAKMQTKSFNASVQPSKQLFGWKMSMFLELSNVCIFMLVALLF